MKPLILTVAAVLTSAANGQSQALDMPAAGTRVRVTIASATDSRGRMTGTVLLADANTLAVKAKKDATLSVPWSSVASLEVHRGRRSSAKRGAIIGGLLFGILGATYVALPSDGGTRGGSAGQVLGGGAFFGAAGALAGALVGAPFRVDRWQKVPLPQSPPVSIVPVHGGIRVQATAKF